MLTSNLVYCEAYLSGKGFLKIGSPPLSPHVLAQAFIPMYNKENVLHDAMGIIRSGYPSFVKSTDTWSRRPDTAQRPFIKDPLFREAGVDCVKHLGNMLIERVAPVGTSGWPINKALLDLRRACSSCAVAAPLMTQAEARHVFAMLKVENLYAKPLNLYAKPLC